MLGAMRSADPYTSPPETNQVLLTGGAIQSPQLLMLSGIGPKEELEAVGVQAKVDRPGVGSNLQDHPAVGACFVHCMHACWS